jgi:26S proteasome regulatory subunit T1
MFGIGPEKSFLFHGPPGTGKTFSFSAVKNEARYNGVSVATFPYSIGKYGTAYINQGSKNLQTFFDQSQTVLKPKGQFDKILYWFDECDALMGKRLSGHASKEDDKLLETLMTNLQRIHDDDRDVLYAFFATNHPDSLDDASKRAGRIDRRVEFKLPNEEERANAYKAEVQKLHDLVGFEYIMIRDYALLARESKGFSYADINSAVESAVREHVHREIHKDGEGLTREIDIPQSLLLDVIRSHKKQTHPEKRIGYGGTK